MKSIAASAPSRLELLQHVHAVGHLFFTSFEEMESAMAAHAAEFVTDQGKYFSGESIVQVSEVVDAA